jgi:hypothetical protein
VLGPAVKALPSISAEEDQVSGYSEALLADLHTGYRCGGGGGRRKRLSSAAGAPFPCKKGLTLHHRR